MELLEQRIVKDGIVAPGDVLKVNSFLNHRLDVQLLGEIGKEFYRLFADCDVNKILTIETSGVAVSCLTAQFFDVPVVFAKKSKTSNISSDVWSAKAHSYTHGNDYTAVVAKEFLGKDDKVLIIDDFLATGEAFEALLSMCGQSGAKVVGCGAVIEKKYQGGGDRIRARGIRVESLAMIKSMSDDGKIEFCH
ncbi:MAG: xanthine phosphoribosyltransferase [Clostridia bacterium]|nr:xanthine phosphoribosyltransferase [Clostridia bacterium]